MNLYAESSAALAWLLEQERGELVADTLAQAELVIASDLTLIECDRVLIRAVVLAELHESDAVHRQARLAAVSTRWTLLGLDEEIIERARRPCPQGSRLSGLWAHTERRRTRPVGSSILTTGKNPISERSACFRLTEGA